MPHPLLEPVVLSDHERATLERWARRPTSAQALALRGRIVLAAASGKNNTAVAAELGVKRDTVRKGDRGSWPITWSVSTTSPAPVPRAPSAMTRWRR
jgi:DNA-binding CsgD family transcriptional regulator